MAKSSARERRHATAAHDRGHTFGLALLRGVVGGFFVGHGAQKVFGAFDGPGPEGAGVFFEQLGLRPGRQMATVAGVTEMTGGGLLALGAATPLASSMLTGVMATAIQKVHRSKGPWVTNGGYEYNAVLIAIVFALSDIGPGKLSVDHLLGRERRGLHWALLSLATGVGASAATLALADRLSPGEQQEAGQPSHNGANAGTEANQEPSAQVSGQRSGEG